LTTPPDRISFGPHVFPFSGLSAAGKEPVPLPLIPIRIRPAGGRWSTPFDAALDTGSTRTLLPKGLAAACGVVAAGAPEEIEAPGVPFQAVPADADLAIVDAHFPEVPVWELHGFRVWVPLREDVLAIPVLGWDLLAKFHVAFDHRRQKVELRLQID
jgi:hypothetical protein